MAHSLARFLVVILLASPAFASAATLTDLQAVLQSLLAQLTELRVQQGVVLGTSTCPNLTRTLSRGSRGAEVMQLQQFLASQGHLATGNDTGYFGASTEAAVKKFQCAAMRLCSGSVRTNGYGSVGPATRVKIANSCSTPPLVQSPALPATTTSALPSPSSGSCAVGATTLANGDSKEFYLLSHVGAGDACADVAQTRTCANGVVSGSSEYSKASCSVRTGAVTNKSLLKDFMPYVYSTTWYPYLSNARGIDSNDSLRRLESELPTIKAQGFNTVWFGGAFIWQKLQPTAGTWNETEFANLTAHLELLKKHNMRAIFQLNYIGPGYAPAGISGCYWMDTPDQLAKWRQFTTELGARLESYNYMIYYMAYTEMDRSCLRERWPYYYSGARMLSVSEMQANGNTADSVTIPDTPENAALHERDARAVNQVLKASIGRFSKPEYMNKTVRNQMFIGIHDTIVSGGVLTNDWPIENPINFDYFSFAYYPTWGQLGSFPTDAQATEPAERLRGYQYVLGELNAQLARIRRFDVNTPVLLGEFGWPSWDAASAKPLAKQDSPARSLVHEAMIDWSIINRTGFNVWGWLPRYIEAPQEELSPYEDALALKLRDGSLSSVLQLFRQKLLGQ